MVRMEEERKVIQESLQNSADEVTRQLAQTTAKNTDLEKAKQVWVSLELSMCKEVWHIGLNR